MKSYVYIFVRQDISVEQQLVQSAHVSFSLGTNAGEIAANIPFVVIGVKNEVGLKAVSKILDAFAFEYEIFTEEDMNDEITAIATYPIAEDARFPLLAFKTLRVSK